MLRHLLSLTLNSVLARRSNSLLGNIPDGLQVDSDPVTVILDPNVQATVHVPLVGGDFTTLACPASFKPVCGKYPHIEAHHAFLKADRMFIMCVV